MKLHIPIKDIMIAPGKRFDPAACSEQDIIKRIRQLYGVIARAMNISIKQVNFRKRKFFSKRPSVSKISPMPITALPCFTAWPTSWKWPDRY